MTQLHDPMRTDAAADAITTSTPQAVALTQLLLDRHSCRGFVDTPVPRRVTEQVLTMAARSPSWCNTQPWQLLVTEGAETDRLREALGKHVRSAAAATPDLPFPDRYAGVYQERRRECGWQLYDAVGVQKGDRTASAQEAFRNFEFFGAPNFALVTSEQDLGVYGAVDCGVYLGVFLLAAQSVGLGAVPQAAVATYSTFLREWFGLPDNRTVVCGVSFGWPDPAHPANAVVTSRARVEDTVRWFGGS